MTVSVAVLNLDSMGDATSFRNNHSCVTSPKESWSSLATVSVADFFDDANFANVNEPLR